MVFNAGGCLFVFGAAEPQAPDLPAYVFALVYLGFLQVQCRTELFEMLHLVGAVQGRSGVGRNLCNARGEQIPFLPPALNLFAALA